MAGVSGSPRVEQKRCPALPRLFLSVPISLVFGIAFVVLGYLGTQLPTATFTLISQVCTLVYFSFFLLMPWWSSMGTFKKVPARVTFHPH
mgnify:CR=1 FL=1